MKKYQWLLDLAEKKPNLFAISILLIAVGVLSGVVQNREKSFERCLADQKRIQTEYNRRLDSVESYYNRRETQLNGEVKEALNRIITNYESQLDEQKKLNDKITTTINENKRIIKAKNL